MLKENDIDERSDDDSFRSNICMCLADGVKLCSSYVGRLAEVRLPSCLSSLLTVASLSCSPASSSLPGAVMQFRRLF